jgi:hypothetical protein
MIEKSVFAHITPASVNKNLIMFVRPELDTPAATPPHVNRNLIMFVRPDLGTPAAIAPHVNKNLIMFVRPDETAAEKLAAPKMLHDIHQSLAGALKHSVAASAFHTA